MIGVESQFDAYIKKTIKNTIITYKMNETKRKQKEIFIEEIEDKELNNSLSSFVEICQNNQIEEIVENEKLAKVLKKLTDKQKKILNLSIIEQYNAVEISKMLNLSDSRIRHIINDVLRQIRKEMEGD